MRTLRRPVILASLLAALAGCGLDLNLDFGGHGYSERNGVLYVDGVALPHKRWVPVDVPTGTDSLKLASATESIVLSGSSDGASHVEVQVYSEVEGDGTVALTGSQVVVTSAGKHGVAINGIRGTLAPGMALELSNGTGEVHLEGLPELVKVDLEVGTGDVRVTQCAAHDVHVTTGTADALLDQLKGDTLGVETGTGQARLTGCEASSIVVTTGTGDVTLKDCTSGETRVESGTGNVSLQGENALGSTRYDLGTGSVREH
jgi:hypothetical protein